MLPSQKMMHTVWPHMYQISVSEGVRRFVLREAEPLDTNSLAHKYIERLPLDNL